MEISRANVGGFLSGSTSPGEGKDTGLGRGGPWATNLEDTAIAGRGGDEMLQCLAVTPDSSAADEILLLSAGDSQAPVVA